MKKLLLFMSLVVGSLSANAQLTCGAPTVINAPGTFVAPIIAGTYENDCWGGTLTDADTPLMANWYAYTPAANGEVTVSSDLAANPANTDTRVSIFRGACGALECYNGSDDVSASNFKTTVTFPVAAGATYYIAWDNFWSPAGFQFTLSFNAVSCLSPGVLNFSAPTDITATSATVAWETAIGSPASYDVDWGAVGHVAGSGTLVNTTSSSAVLSGLTTGANLDYFVRSNCGGTQGAWRGPFDLYLATSMPYNNNFDNATDPANGFTFSGWNLTTANANISESSPNFIFSNVGTVAPADSFAFFRAITLQANETVTMDFMAWYLAADLDTATFSLTVGNAPTAAAQTTTAATFNLAGNALAIAWEPLTATFMAPSTGVYYFAFHNTSAPASDDSTLVVDTITSSSVLSVNDVLSNKFSVFPNPATNVISISNNENILVNNVVLTDLNGRIVKNVNFSNVSSVQVNVSDLATGMYMLNVTTDQGSLVKKLMKN